MAAMAVAACHVKSSSEITRPGKVERITHAGGAVAQRASLVLTDGGELRFVEALACPTEEIVTEERTRETVRGPNLATFVVGVIATAVGGVLLVSGISKDDRENPGTYGGGALLAGGLPFAIGPWIGNATELAPLGTAPPIRRGGPLAACGERGIASAPSATLAVRGIEVYGTIGADGVFSVSPFAIVDAFDAGTAAWTFAARLDARTIASAIAARAFAGAAERYLQRADFDTRIEALRLVPNIVPGALGVSLARTADGTDAARIVLAIKNDGPGPVYRLRGHLAAPGTPSLDGRILYFGHIAKGAVVTRELAIPLAPRTASALRTTAIELALELRDAHGTAPQTPVRFRGVPPVAR